MTYRYSRLAALSLIGMALMAGGAARAQTFDVPDGFSSEVVRESDRAGGMVSVLRVQPENGAFANLSAIDMRPLNEAVADADGWLRARMTAWSDSLYADSEANGMFDGPDSPFADPAFDALREGLSSLTERLKSLGSLPLDYCDDPRGRRNGAGELREMSCTFSLGPVRHHVVLRLQEVAGVWYYTRIRTMNERRLRHLLAIANSFRVD